ncbi:hypothetical protein LguiA_002033 [Lonicera macranthoides]
MNALAQSHSLSLFLGLLDCKRIRRRQTHRTASDPPELANANPLRQLRMMLLHLRLSWLKFQQRNTIIPLLMTIMILLPIRQIPVAATCSERTSLSSIATQNRDVTVGEGILPADHNASLPSNASMAFKEVFGAHSPTSREALADTRFEAAIARPSNNDGCIKLLEDDRSSILNQNFHPLGTTYSSSSIQKSSPHSPSSSSIAGHTQGTSPLQTRGSRKDQKPHPFKSSH